MRQFCPFHADEDIEGVWASEEEGYSFSCDRGGHPEPGAYGWNSEAEEPVGEGLSGLAEELGLDTSLPAVVASFGGRWVEYGVVERSFALANPKEWDRLVSEKSHRAIEQGLSTTVSIFLARTLRTLGQRGHFDFRYEKATGRWSYNSKISWWAAYPSGEWEDRLSWEADGPSTAYVPGSTETP